jgi:hypothetical protein
MENGEDEEEEELRERQQYELQVSSSIMVVRRGEGMEDSFFQITAGVYILVQEPYLPPLSKIFPFLSAKM